MTFDELVAKSLAHATDAESILTGLIVDEPEELARAQVHATLSEAYARLASGVIVNLTSMHHALEQIQSKRPVS